MQHKQQNYRVGRAGAILVLGGFLTLAAAHAAGISGPQKPDPILQGGPVGPCAPATEGADLVGGTDINGQPVAGADLDRPPVPVPGVLDVPLKARRGKAPAYVRVDGKSLAPLLNPPPGCAARQPGH